MATNNTIVKYLNGSISSYNIVGELTGSKISNIKNSVQVDIGTDVTRIG